MRRTEILLCCAAAMFLLLHCGGNRYEAEIRTLDSLKTEITAANKVFAATDTSPLSIVKKQVFEDLRFLIRNYKPDSISAEAAGTMSAYKDLRKQCAAYTMLGSRLKKNYGYSVKQVNDLLYDLKEGSLSAKEAAKYIEVEKKAATSMLQAYAAWQQGIVRISKQFDSLQPAINGIIKSVGDTLLPVR